MEISSDTNVWIDFNIVGGLELPFRLAHVFCMSSDALGDEVLSPPELSVRLIDLGLVPLEITYGEFILALRINDEYFRLSRYDAIALSIAKLRGFDLLSGDKALRSAAVSEGVEVRGTLWVYDELVRVGRISMVERLEFLSLLEKNNGGCRGIRLPGNEIKKRLEDLK